MTKPVLENTDLIAVGWREWVSLPGINLPLIKAKVDTGARTSALHAFVLHTFHNNDIEFVRFLIHPLQERNDIVRECMAEIKDTRWVTDSGGHKEQRYVISTTINIGTHQWPIEMTLTNRDTMKFRMLLGRTAMENKLVVNPAGSYLHGRHSKNNCEKHYIKGNKE